MIKYIYIFLQFHAFIHLKITTIIKNFLNDFDVLMHVITKLRLKLRTSQVPLLFQYQISGSGTNMQL